MLSKFVLATIVYYDTLEYPMTAFEMWKHLLIPDGVTNIPKASLRAIEQTLESLQSRGSVEQHHGFWVLPRRGKLVLDRIQREKRAVEKIKRAVKLIRRCSWIPFIRMIALTGSLSMKQGDRLSDWDLLVVMKSGAIWTGRFLLTFWLTILGQRRHGQHITDRACLNCYLADSALEVPLKDVFSSHEYRFMYPVTGEDTFRSFELANRWMARYRPHFLPTTVPSLFLTSPQRWVGISQSVLEQLFTHRWLEKYLGQYQRQRIEQNPKTQISGGFILANDEALVFLPEPKGPKVFDRFKESLSQNSL